MGLSDAEALKKRREREEADRLLREDAQKTVMSTVAGQRFVWDLLDRVCGTFGGSFVQGEEHSTSFNEGMRAVGIQVMRELQAVAPQAYVAMLLERTQAANAEAAMRKSETVPNAGDRSST